MGKSPYKGINMISRSTFNCICIFSALRLWKCVLMIEYALRAEVINETLGHADTHADDCNLDHMLQMPLAFTSSFQVFGVTSQYCGRWWICSKEAIVDRSKKIMEV
eukprot:TRINITY_DN5327_c1_g1_i2.p1 TRINITY_DN5327_c1_g1~~TRINITY_DN5327_c1_g1_i2.p1  ORF type:complete len:106 (-),score=11.08 TRINITY_DN5327_c1_g1_i2:1864-2181(-)